MESIESLDKVQNILKYAKYILLVIVVVVVFLLIKSCDRTYSDIESDAIIQAKKYITDNNINVSSEIYVELTKLDEVEGTELCKKASGVIVENDNGTLKYQAFLDCADYKSSLTSTKGKYAVLNGDSVVILNEGEVYNDPLYTLFQDADVIISGNVLTIPGIYTKTYTVYNASKVKEVLTRKIIVTKNDKDSTISGLINPEEPILTLKGDKQITIGIGEKYIEPGYTAVDYVDGKISRQVKISGAVNEKSVGTYTITYTSTNSKGKSAIAVRIINVVKEKANLDIQATVNDLNIVKKTSISLNVSGDGYDYTLMPDGTKNYYRMPTYNVTENKLYTFKIFDRFGNEFVKEVEINNIDNIPPSGTCTALVRGQNTEVEVIASDNKGIAGYKYILDGSSTDYIGTNTYSVSKSSKSVKVNIADIVGNNIEISCATTIKNTTTVSANINTSEYNLVATKSDVIAFAEAVDSKNVAQNHSPEYSSLCLSFAYYHAYKLYSGDDFSTLSALAASKYEFATKFRGVVNDSKDYILKEVYKLIESGQPCILHVNGNKEGTSRHYVTVVGYRSGVTEDTITDKDLLIIDSYDGKLESMDAENSRFMISGHDTGRTGSDAYGYQIYVLR